MVLSRRSFLKTASAVSLFNIVPAHVLRGATAPSNQLTRALIGFGSIAHSFNHLKFPGSRLIGLCDADRRRVGEGLHCARQAGWGTVKAYDNFMKLLEDPDVDIVHICTPPHWHGVMSVMAARAGKDIWCEKPMTRTVGEGRRVAEYVKSKGIIFRLNTWFRFQNPFYGFGAPVKPVRQFVENGLVASKGSPIRCVVGPGQGFSWKFFWSGRVKQVAEVCPKELDWDMWLGPAPAKPYNSHRAHLNFRGYWDYDSGGLGDMAQHYLDPVQYLLCKDDTSPVHIDYIGPKQHPEAVGGFDRLTLRYADGTEVVLDGNGSLKDEPFLRGDRGCVFPGNVQLQADVQWTPPEDTTKMFTAKDANGKALDVRALLKELPEPAPQNTDFIDCVRNRKTFALNEQNGFRSASMFNLAVVAERLGRGFDFDPIALHAVHDEAAERFLYPTLRAPWDEAFYKN